MEVAYSRRWYHGQTVNDNLLTQPSDYTPYSITAPQDPRLPDGGGYVDLRPLRHRPGQVRPDQQSGHELAQQFGNWYHYFNGVDITLNVRARGGLTFQGGTSTGQTVADNCDVRANLPELNAGLGAGLGGSGVSTTSPYCHVAYGVLTQLRGLGATRSRKPTCRSARVFQSKPGALLSANYAVPAATVAQTLGRPPSGNATSVTVNLIEPGSEYGDRLNQLDFRVAKILRFGGTRTMVGIDLYNALNSSAILTYNNTFVPNGTWKQPQTVLTARLLKVTMELHSEAGGRAICHEQHEGPKDLYILSVLSVVSWLSKVRILVCRSGLPSGLSFSYAPARLHPAPSTKSAPPT